MIKDGESRLNCQAKMGQEPRIQIHGPERQLKHFTKLLQEVKAEIERNLVVLETTINSSREYIDMTTVRELETSYACQITSIRVQRKPEHQYVNAYFTFKLQQKVCCNSYKRKLVD
jgi:hypothetical protein